MSGFHWNVVAAFLRSAGLLAGTLAVFAGILGMHVVTGGHSMHSTPALTAAAGAGAVHTHSAAAHGHAGQGVTDASPAHDPSDGHTAPSIVVEQCSCSDSCASVHAMRVSCTPSGKTGSLSVPLPGTAVVGVIANATAPGAVPGSYSYRPGSPSPGELSISRT